MKNSDQPAFARAAQFGAQNNFYVTDEPGLTKREYLAGLAMQAMITAITKFREDNPDIIINRPSDIAELSVLYADTLLMQLEK